MILELFDTFENFLIGPLALVIYSMTVVNIPVVRQY